MYYSALVDNDKDMTMFEGKNSLTKEDCVKAVIKFMADPEIKTEKDLNKNDITISETEKPI